MPVTDPGRRIITFRKAKKGRGRGDELAIGIEYKHCGIYLVDNNERHPFIIARIHNPIRNILGAV